MTKASTSPLRGPGFRLRHSTPLASLGDEAQALSSKCNELWIATAFVDERALRHVVQPALDAGANVRFLTGTFGHVTRLRTFKHLERLAREEGLEARVWEGDFHVKLFIWGFGAQAVAWIGSANLTADGLMREGELVLQVKGPWARPRQRQWRSCFVREWVRGTVLDAGFLSRYRESPRAEWLLRAKSPKPAPRASPRGVAKGERALLVVPMDYHYPVESRVVVRVDALLGGIAKAWYRGSGRALEHVRRDCLCLIVDYKDREIVLGVVTDTKRDGRGHIFAYRVVGSPRPIANLTRRQAALGLGAANRQVRTRWIDRDHALGLVGTLFGTRTAGRVLSSR